MGNSPRLHSPRSLDGQQSGPLAEDQQRAPSIGSPPRQLSQPIVTDAKGHDQDGLSPRQKDEGSAQERTKGHRSIFRKGEKLKKRQGRTQKQLGGVQIVALAVQTPNRTIDPPNNPQDSGAAIQGTTFPTKGFPSGGGISEEGVKPESEGPKTERVSKAENYPQGWNFAQNNRYLRRNEYPQGFLRYGEKKPPPYEDDGNLHDDEELEEEEEEEEEEETEEEYNRRIRQEREKRAVERCDRWSLAAFMTLMACTVGKTMLTALGVA